MRHSGPNVARVARRVRRPSQELPVRRRLRRGNPIPELGRSLEMLLRFGIGEQLPRPMPGLHQRGEGELEVVGRECVVGELGMYAVRTVGGERGILAQGPRERTVQSCAFPWQELLMRGLLQERVPKPVAVAVGNQGLVLDRRPQPAVELVVGQLGHAFEESVVDATASCGSDAQDLLGLLGQSIEPGAQDVAKRGGDSRFAEHTCGHQLFGEEGVALGTLHDRADLGLGRRRAGDGRDQLDDLGLVQRLEVDAFHERQTAELGENRTQGMRFAHLVGAVGADKQHPALAEVASEKGDEVKCRPVGPVQVLEDQDNG